MMCGRSFHAGTSLSFTLTGRGIHELPLAPYAATALGAKYLSAAAQCVCAVVLKLVGSGGDSRLSAEFPPVAPPLVSPFNKETVSSRPQLIAWTDTDTIASQVELAHLKSPRDVFDVHLTAASRSSLHEETEGVALFKCPVTSMQCNAPGAQFTALRSCGHVLSTRALLTVRPLVRMLQMGAGEASDALTRLSVSWGSGPVAYVGLP
jgi:hypothetical protein